MMLALDGIYVATEPNFPICAPQPRAQLCPVCLGKGTVAEQDFGYTSGTNPKTCHGCGGLGWVTVK